MRVYAIFNNNDGFATGDFFDEISHPPVLRAERVRPEDAPADFPENEWPQVTVFVRRNDDIPPEAVEISEADRGAIVGAPQFHRWENGTLVALPVPAVTVAMPDISDRQFGEGLWRDGLISYEDYLAFVGPGTIPPPLQALIDTLPDDETGQPTERKIVRGLVTGAQTYRFDNPFVDVVRQARNWTVDHLRERWLAWSAL